ncbi:phenylalanine--tRNA ligase subunit alpha [Balneolaceae bacterium ANBcel3]|nr:phenylalanine--tRNA ligase subunit alpha [Balneolaceae bacterium ANBcel3]
MSHLPDIDALKEEISSFPVDSKENLEAFRLKYLSRKGRITELLAGIGKAAPEDRARLGKELNILKNLAVLRFDEASASLETSTGKKRAAHDDPTLTPPPLLNGSSHPLSQTMEEIKTIFYRLGFTIADGPELEDDFHNFTALNFPPEHPARDMQDTFFIRKEEDHPEKDLVLRTHTSPVQIRLMKNGKPPFRAIMPGRVYRNESITAKSYCLFHQVEGLYVDKKVSLADLKHTLITFARHLFGKQLKYRIRPSFFPFTEPSLEMDIWWETGNKPGQWMEILGAGMVHPNVLKAVDIDPEEWSGFAFGMGVERITMSRYEIDDIRLLYDNDIRFLTQFP